MSKTTFKRIAAVSLALLAAAHLTGCGGDDNYNGSTGGTGGSGGTGGNGGNGGTGGSGGNGDPGGSGGNGGTGGTGTGSATGVFLDSPVQGLRYTTSPSNITGVTNAAGEFTYNPGDTVSFALGDLVLGSVTAQETVTPLTIAQALVAENPSGDVETITVNVLAFLQSLDADGNPDNGIAISTAVAGAMSANAISFVANAGTFTTALTNLVTTIESATSADLTVVSREDATRHFVDQVPKLVAGTYVAADAQGAPVTQYTRTLTLFDNGTYLYGGHDDDTACNGDGNDEDRDGNGVEMGGYAFNPLTGALTFTKSFETNGSCGPETPAGEYLTLSIEGNVLHIGAGDETTYWVAVPSTTGELAGSWGLPVALLNDKPFVLSFFPSATAASSGRYFVVDAMLEAHDSIYDASSGIEEGCYTIGVNGSFEVDLDPATCPGAIDTNGTAGLSHPQNPFFAAVDAYGRFRINEGPIGDDGTTDFVRLPLQAVAAEDRVGTWYMEAAGMTPEENPNLWVASILADGRYLAGGIEGDADCTDSSNPYEDEDGNGAEYGQITALENGLAGIVTARASTDTNGSCGLADEHHPAQRFMFVRSQIDQTMLFFAYDDDMGMTLKRVPSVANNVVGAWLYDDVEPDHPHLAVFFPNNVLFEVSAGVGAEAGLWRSRYEVSGNRLTLIAGGADCLDTMGFASCEPTEVEELLEMTVTSTTLTLGNADESYSLTKISAP